jgi:hypothetical protein
MKTLRTPLLINQLPDRRMGRKVFTRWLNGKLLELLASANSTSPEELAVILRHSRASAAVLGVLDEIIIMQAIGFGIQTLLAPLAFTRYLTWEKLAEGDKLMERFHRSLQYHWRIIHHLDPPPLPAGMRGYKQELVAELRPVVKRIRRHGRGQHRSPSPKEILEQFSLVVTELNCRHLGSQANRVSWSTFLAHEPGITKRMYSGLLTPTDLFHEWLAWCWQLRADSVRQAISRQ